MKPNGFVLFEDRVRTVIATGFKRSTKNRKTGKMIQVWILRKDLSPIESVTTGKDKAICCDCPLRGNKGQNRACYVTYSQAPQAVYKAYRRGAYPRITDNDYSIFAGRSVRFGAYGEPVFIPFTILSTIAGLASNWTGYTHQWRNPLYRAYREYLMASVENPEGYREAKAAGWRTFRVVAQDSDRTPGEIVCVNVTRGIQCQRCGLCGGKSTNAKSITIPVHGNGKAYFGKN